MSADASHPPPRLPISVFLICHNEAARIGRTLRAVAFADDIVVVDSASTDGTPAIAARAGARVIDRPFEGYGPQKAFAERECRHAWRLNVDADEEVTPQLAASIRTVVEAGHKPAAFRIDILNVYPGDDAPRPFANDYRVVRFYHRDAGAYRDHPLFDRVEVREGYPCLRLAGAIHHHAFTSWAHLCDKLNTYTSYAARTARVRPKAVLLLRLPLEFPLTFVKAFVLRRHLFGGWKGFAFATVQAFFRTVRLIKMLERANEAAASRAAGGAPADADPAPTRIEPQGKVPERAREVAR